MATSNFIQSVKDETKGADRSVRWYRNKIKEFGKMYRTIDEWKELNKGIHAIKMSRMCN